MQTKLPDIKQNFPEWYQDVVYKAQLADQSPIRGAMVVRPYGCALWENITKILDQKIKDTGHQNALFPLFIPKAFLDKEADHVEGFSPELAVVTHAGGKELEEPLVVRPTSETIIHYMFAQWLKSWRDLPIKINQWASVVRWEMRPRPFLRTTEIFWQEGHTAHETQQEAYDEAVLMLEQYKDVYENYLAIPVVPGLKSEAEKFPGADKTYTLEGLMPDGKALQLCTSHVISQNFAKSFNMTYQDREGKQAYPYLTSWGFTTRSIGALVMVHGDQNGLVLPPKVAPIQVVIIPIFVKGFDKELLLAKTKAMAEQLKIAGIRAEIDARDYETPGAKFFEWELKGVPLRIEVGPRDLENGTFVAVDRLGLSKDKVAFAEIDIYAQRKLNLVQQKLFERAKAMLHDGWHKKATLKEFSADLEHGGFFQTGWCDAPACELVLKEYKASIRCLLPEKSIKACFNCGKESKTDILIARSY